MLGPVLIFIAGIAATVAVGAVALFYWQRHQAAVAQAAAPEVRDAALPERTGPTSDPFAQYWSQRLFDLLEWRRFEWLVSAYIGQLGFEAKPVRIGEDGMIELQGFEPGVEKPHMIVRCQAWNRNRVEVGAVEALHRQMLETGVPQGAYFNTAGFSQAAMVFATNKEIDLVSGAELLSRLGELPLATQTELLDQLTDGDYTTPTCPACDQKMVRRVVVQGAQAGVYFWGCRNYPTCARTFPIG
jgi:restriction system protein